MPIKDYAKRPARHGATRKKAKKNPFAFPLLLMSLMGIIIASFLVLKHSSTTKNQTPKVSDTTPTPVKLADVKNTSETAALKKIAAKKEIKITPEAEPQFDFYTLLPQMEVSVPEATANAINTAPQSYLLQVASLKDPHDANRLRDKLQGMGLMASVESYQSSSGTRWNRVIAGPYTELKAAEDAQDILLDQHIDSLLLRIKDRSAK